MARRNRERRKKKERKLFLTPFISNGKPSMMLALSISSAICKKSLVTLFSTLWGSFSISLCTLCNHCLSERTSAGTSTSKAAYPLVALSFESTPYDVDNLFFNVLSDLCSQGLPQLVVADLLLSSVVVFLYLPSSITCVLFHLNVAFLYSLLPTISSLL